MQSGVPYYGYELKVNMPRKKQREKGFFNFVYSPLLDNQKAVTGIMVIASEVTDQVLARKRVEESGFRYHNMIHTSPSLISILKGKNMIIEIANEVTPQAILNKKLRESESHFRQMASLMPAKISNADINGNVTYFNKNWLDFTGLDFEELKEIGYHKIMHPEEMEEFAERRQKALETKTDLEMEMRFLNKDGDYVWHLNIASPVTDENGDFQTWIGVTTDITEQIRARKSNLETYKKHADELEKQVTERTVQLKAANDRLQDRNRELKRMNEELEAFTFGASHDLQEPLRKIQAFVARITDIEGDGMTDRGKDYFLRIQEVSERMRQLIEDLLEFSRLGSSEMTFTKTDLGKITVSASNRNTGDRYSRYSSACMESKSIRAPG